MKNLDINNLEHRKAIEEVLRQGAQTDFWNIICQRIQRAIDGVQNTLDSDVLDKEPADEYKVKSRVLIKEKNNLTGILDLPETMVRELEAPDFMKQDADKDVYAEKEDFEK